MIVGVVHGCNCVLVDVRADVWWCLCVLELTFGGVQVC